LFLIWHGLSCRAVKEISISQPSANQTVAGVITFMAQASSDTASVKFDIGSLKLGTKNGAPFSVVWNSGYAGDGTYAVEAIALDRAGKEIGTASEMFTIDNRHVTLNVTAPDLSKSMSGSFRLSVAEKDPQYFPALLSIYVDGTNVGKVWTDHAHRHSAKVTITIDTTQFTNGPHELNMNSMSNDAAGNWYNYRAGYNRIIDIENGHTLMDVAANYLEIYLQPGGTTLLTCRDLFTDATSAPCISPIYASSDDTHVAVDGSGNVTAAHSEGFASVSLSDRGKSTAAYVTVRTSPGVPHFGGNGQVLNAYTPGQSLFTISLFNTDVHQFQVHPRWTAALKAAGINTLSQGIYSNPRNIAQDLATWKSQYDDHYTQSFEWAAAQGFHLLLTGDDITRSICNDAWYTFTWPSGQQAIQYAFERAASTGVAIGVDMVDETDSVWGNTPYPTADWTSNGCAMPNTWIATLRAWIRAASPTLPISWPNLGIASVADWANWDGVGGVADYVTQYFDTFQDDRTYNWSSGVLEKNYWMWKVFYDRQPYMMLDRPQLELRSATGAYYIKESNGSFYNPPTDVLIQPGDIGAVVSSGIMSAAALGEAGVRLYFWQSSDDMAHRSTYPNGTQLQTGVNPIDSNREIAANWQGISNASNAIAALTPYLLAAPLNSPAYGRNILTAARQGAGGRLLLIVNDNDFKRTIPVDFTPFAYSDGAITKYLVGADLLAKTSLSGSASADIATLDGGESAAYVFALANHE
jgi:hypothetical protein